MGLGLVAELPSRTCPQKDESIIEQMGCSRTFCRRADDLGCLLFARGSVVLGFRLVGAGAPYTLQDLSPSGYAQF